VLDQPRAGVGVAGRDGCVPGDRTLRRRRPQD
jgi:hypothetical protein